MKLSEILGFHAPMDEGDIFCDDPEGRAFNTALTSCDREIDREALENVLLNMIVYFISEESMESADKIRGYKDRIVDSFISTMPTWLRKGVRNEKI